jgi:hypothetical protein
MDYSAAQLTTVADCDAILAMAAKEKGDLEYRQTGIRRQQTSYADNSVEITTELAAVEAEIEAYTDIISGLPDGQSKKDAQTRLTKLEYRKFLLSSRQEDFGSLALLVKEMELGQLEKQLEELTAFQTAVTTRKAAL